MLDRRGLGPAAGRLGRARPRTGGRSGTWELDARREVLRLGLRPDLERVGRVAAAALDVPRRRRPARRGRDAERAPRALPHVPPRRRGPRRRWRPRSSAPSRTGPSRPPLIERLAAALDEPGEWRDRWQQLTGPATAKGVEDRAFWRYAAARVAGRGRRPRRARSVDGRGRRGPRPPRRRRRRRGRARCSPARPTTSPAARTCAPPAWRWPRSPDRWDAVVDAWRTGPGALLDVDPATQWLALQTVATTAGLDAERLREFLVKAAREADLHTSWTAPAEPYEIALGRLAGVLVTWEPVRELAAALHRPGRATSLALLVARITAPGVVDVYQGTEAFRDLLVDPDNRIPPDHAALDALVERAAATDGRWAWAEPEPVAARAVALARLLPLIDPTDGYAALGRARGAAGVHPHGDRRHAAARHHRAARRRAAGRAWWSTSRRGRGGTCSSTACPTSTGQLAVDEAARRLPRDRPRQRLTSSTAPGPSTTMPSAPSTAGAAVGLPRRRVERDGEVAAALERHGRRSVTERQHDDGAIGVPPALQHDRLAVDRDGLLGVAAEHAVATPLGEQLGVRLEHPAMGLVGGERRVEHGAAERRRVAGVGDLLGPLVAELATAARSRGGQQLVVVVADEERERRRVGVLLAHEQHRGERRQQDRRRGQQALAVVERRALPGRRVADVVVVAGEDDEALRARRRRRGGRGSGRGRRTSGRRRASDGPAPSRGRSDAAVVRRSSRDGRR